MNYVTTRPFLEYFLREMSRLFEITVFTAAREDYADVIIDELDKHNYISNRLYRRHMTKLNGVSIKDLSMIGRDLTRTIIIDNIEENYMKQPENGVKIPSFFGVQDDVKLLGLAKELKKVISVLPNDVRPFLSNIRDRINIESRPKLNTIAVSLNAAKV